MDNIAQTESTSARACTKLSCNTIIFAPFLCVRVAKQVKNAFVEAKVIIHPIRLHAVFWVNIHILVVQVRRVQSELHEVPAGMVRRRK